MFKLNSIKLLSILSLLALVTSGCATKITETPSPVTPTKVKLGSYSKVILVQSEIAPTYAKNAENIKAANKIDSELKQSMNTIFPSLEVKSPAEAKKMIATPDTKVLVIKPYIKQIKFIGVGARIMVGAMAGSSVVIMDVTYIDGSNGEKLSNPGFMRQAGAYSDAFGVASNSMLSEIARDVLLYTASNK